MKRVDAKTHEQWQQYIGRGGTLNQASFIKFQERYPQVLGNLENHDSLSEAHESGTEAGLIVDTGFCAAFSTLREPLLDLRTTDASPIYWRSNGWLVRESLLLTNDPAYSRIPEQTY